MRVSRRAFLRTTGSGVVAAGGGWGGRPAHAQKKQVVTIAFPETVTSMDPHPAPRNSPRESMYEAVFDRFLQQDRQGKYGPNVIESWQWTDGKMGMTIKIRQGVKFHDGSDLTAEDVAFSMNRLKEVSIYKATYAKVKEYQVRDKATLQLVFERFDPSFPRWLGFLAGFVVPQAYFQSLGPDDKARAEEFARKPVGSGPYRVVVLHAGQHARAGGLRPLLEGRAADQARRLQDGHRPDGPGCRDPVGQRRHHLRGPRRGVRPARDPATFKGVKQPVADMAQIFVNPRFEPFKKEGVRLAVHYAIDKKTIVEKVLLGFGVPLSLTEGPLYDAYDPSFSFPYDPAKARQLLQTAGYSAANPLRLKVMTTRGVRAKDFEFMSAITQMWKDVGIEAELEVITIPQWFQFRTARGQGGQDLAPLSLYFWSNPTGDPINSVGFQNNVKGPFRVWESEDLRPRDRPDLRRAGRGQAHRRGEEGRSLRRGEGLHHPALPGGPAGRHEEGPRLPAVPDRRPGAAGDVLAVGSSGDPARVSCTGGRWSGPPDSAG